MEIKILWSDSALEQLEKIFDYHKTAASPEIARKLVKSIIRKALILETNPMMGAKEPLLANRAIEYRYLVEKNYKIIYRFDGQFIRINMVFDCRQNPTRMEVISD